HVLSDRTGHSKTDIGVNVDLAYCKLSCLSKLLFRNTNSIRHISAVLIYHLYELLRNGRRAVKNNRESQKSLNALFQHVETQWRRNQNADSIACALIRSEFVCSVGSTDSNRKRITACPAYEHRYFFRTGVALMTSCHNDFVLDTSQSTQLSRNNNAISMR